MSRPYDRRFVSLATSSPNWRSVGLVRRGAADGGAAFAAPIALFCLRWSSSSALVFDASNGARASVGRRRDANSNLRAAELARRPIRRSQHRAARPAERCATRSPPIRTWRVAESCSPTPDGAIIASEPETGSDDSTLAELLGAAAPLAILAEKAGAMRIQRRRPGRRGFAAVRNLTGSARPDRRHPVELAMLAPWRRRARAHDCAARGRPGLRSAACSASA